MYERVDRQAVTCKGRVYEKTGRQKAVTCDRDENLKLDTSSCWLL
jgi:hypothetical protein